MSRGASAESASGAAAFPPFLLPRFLLLAAEQRSSSPSRPAAFGAQGSKSGRWVIPAKKYAVMSPQTSLACNYIKSYVHGTEIKSCTPDAGFWVIWIEMTSPHPPFPLM